MCRGYDVQPIMWWLEEHNIKAKPVCHWLKIVKLKYK